MDYRRTYNEFRDGLINRIIANADEINSKPNIRILGYHVCEEWDENIESTDGSNALRVFYEPIFVTGIRGCRAMGYPAVNFNCYYGVESYYYLKELSIETLINLCEIIE